jgi:hypothetical protein
MRFFRYLAAAALVTTVTGCSDALEVQNRNNPDRQRVLREPADVEGLASSQFQQVISGTLGNIARVHTGMLTAGLENASGLANNGMGPRGGIPRQPIDNNRGNAYQTEHFNDFRILSSVARNSADILSRGKAETFSLGANRQGDVTRMIAWAHFVAGVANGYLSLTYDSAGVARPTDAAADIPALEGYAAVNAYALAQFDSALAYTARAGMTALPGGWLTGPGGAEVSVARFQQVIRSFRARMRANVARTPAEREAVDWQAVIADATAGIDSDLVIRLNPTQGWDYHWLATTLHFRDANWHQMTPYIIGMADVSGGYDAWLATPRDQRTPFTIVTPDLRFPRGTTRAEQNRPVADDDTPLPAGQYFRNRNPGKDQAAVGWANSQYDHWRFRELANANRVGDLPFFTRAENDMLAAEGHIRRGNIAAAAALIDRYRTRNGLPALTGAVTTREQPVPGGANCVPRVPAGPTFATTACGNIMEAMKWEKRMETAFTTYGGWFFDGRGWGDLPAGTAVHWPVPNQERDARQLPIYNLGGVGQPGGAAAGTYGFGVGDR